MARAPAVPIITLGGGGRGRHLPPALPWPGPVELACRAVCAASCALAFCSQHLAFPRPLRVGRCSSSWGASSRPEVQGQAEDPCPWSCFGQVRSRTAESPLPVATAGASVPFLKDLGTLSGCGEPSL